MDWYIRDSCMYPHRHWNDQKWWRRPLHGLNTCLGRSLRIAALVRPKSPVILSEILTCIRSLAYQFIVGLPFSSTLVPILLPTFYLWIVDTLALRRGTWVIESGTKLGWHLWDGLDIEYEHSFQLLTEQEAKDCAERQSFSSSQMSSLSLV